MKQRSGRRKVTPSVDVDLTPEQVRELEKKLFELGKKKYHLDEKTAKLWARRMAVA